MSGVTSLYPPLIVISVAYFVLIVVVFSTLKVKVFVLTVFLSFPLSLVRSLLRQTYTTHENTTSNYALNTVMYTICNSEFIIIPLIISNLRRFLKSSIDKLQYRCMCKGENFRSTAPDRLSMSPPSWWLWPVGADIYGKQGRRTVDI